jgi:hypothetical protein
MPNPLYTRLQATAERLLSKYGQAGTVTRYAAPDDIFGGDPVPTPYPAKIFPDTYEAREIDGTVIKTGDVKLYISAVGLPITPEPDDTATCNGKTYRIVTADPNLYDGQTPVVHIVQGRLNQ